MRRENKTKKDTYRNIKHPFFKSLAFNTSLKMTSYNYIMPALHFQGWMQYKAPTDKILDYELSSQCSKKKKKKVVFFA